MAHVRKTLPTLLAVLSLAATPGDAAVLVVGTTSYSPSDVERWLSITPVSERETMTTRDPAQLRSMLEGHFVPHALLMEHAASTLAADAEFERIRDGALAEHLGRELQAAAIIREDQIAKFYAENIDRYVSPEAIHLWRILVPDEATANAIINQIQGKRLGVYEWGNLARKHSKDAATNQRDGDLGFVRADGTTDVPQVRVAPALHAAASRVRDGELVAQPVRERDQFAVVWRRGTRPEKSLSLDSQRENIRTVLKRNATQRARHELLQTLRAQHMSVHAPEAIESQDYPLTETTPQRDRSLHPRAPDRPPHPQQTDRGQR